MIPTPSFTAALKFAAHASAKKDVRYYMNGVLFDFEYDKLILVGTDGARAAIVKMPTALPFEGQFAVPTKSVKALLASFAKDGQGLINFTLTDKALTVTSTSGIAFKPELTECNFFNWRGCIPAADRAPGPMPSVDVRWLGEACAALTPLSLGYGELSVAIRPHTAGPDKPIVLRPWHIKPDGISEALVVISSIKE